MNINDELGRWGEPPMTAGEEALLALFDAPARGARPTDTLVEPPATALLRRLEESTASFHGEAGLLDSPSQSAAEASTLPNPFPADFRFLRLLGKGGYGRVWLAEDVKLGGRPVALKTLKVAGDPARRAALEREAGILGRLDHPNLVRVHSWRESGTEVWLVMQYVAGGSLEDRLEREGPLPWSEAARYVADVAEGLAHAHAAGVVHRDIKPDNILFDPALHKNQLSDRCFCAGTDTAQNPTVLTVRESQPQTVLKNSEETASGVLTTLLGLLQCHCHHSRVARRLEVGRVQRMSLDPSKWVCGHVAVIETDTP